jgi:hypothetical protein
MWEDAMEFSLGHLMFTHEGWWKRFCEHDYAAHGARGSWCLDCGAEVPALST